jgi:hypothetical protein
VEECAHIWPGKIFNKDIAQSPTSTKNIQHPKLYKCNYRLTIHENWWRYENLFIRRRGYCVGYGVCYATVSKIHVTTPRQMWKIWFLLRNGFQSTRYITKTDLSIDSQRLGIPRQPNCWNPQQHLLTWETKSFKKVSSSPSDCRR